jgi:quercetin dioxygenase-like cupin family protein
MTMTTGKVVVLDDVSPVHWMGEHGRFLLRSEDTNGLFSFFEVTTLPDGGPPLHMHDDHDEALFVLEGQYEIRVDERTIAGRPGTVAYSPRGVAHRFRNVLDTPSRLLVVASPGGHERFFEELSEVLAAGPPDPAKLVEVATRNHVIGLEPVGPGGPRRAGAAAAGAGPAGAGPSR